MSEEINIAKVKEFGASVDFGKTASDYSTFRAGFPPEFFEALFNHTPIPQHAMAIDVGTGTGTLARGLAKRGLQVIGIDPAAPLLEEAVKLDAAANVVVEYQNGSAEKLDQPDASIDLVTAGQCWHWFDRPKAAREAYRVLKAGGTITIAHFDWLPLKGNVVEATETLILKYNPKWALNGGTGLYPAWLADMSGAGFENITTRSFDIFQPYSPEAWRGRIRASAGIKASLNTDAIQAFDRELQDLLISRFPQDPLLIPHRIWFACARKP